MRFTSPQQRRAAFARMLKGDAYLVKHSEPGKKGHTHLKIGWDGQETVKSFVVPNLLPKKKGERKLALYLGRYPKGRALRVGKGDSKKRIGRALKFGAGKYKLPNDIWMMKMKDKRYLLSKNR